MAQRRMFNLQVIDSDAFIGMPATTQNLYFHLCMRADDDGFISGPKKIQRMIGASDDDMQILLAKRFLLAFDSGVVVVKHWRLHNYIQKDRYHETLYKEEKATLFAKPNGVYTDHPLLQKTVETKALPCDASNMETECIQDVSKTCPQVRLGKSKSNNISSSYEEDASHFLQKSDSTKSDVQEVVDAWNSLNLRRVTKLAPDTKRCIMLKKRINDYGLDEVLRAIENVRTSQFLNGNNRKGFTCTFDWFVKPNNFPKVLDGNYNDDDKPKLDPRAYDGARWLAGQIAERVSGFQTPSPQELDRWAADLDALHAQGYTWKQISDTAVWALSDDFWAPVIVSGAALRKNFVKLLAREANESD